MALLGGGSDFCISYLDSETVFKFLPCYMFTVTHKFVKSRLKLKGMCMIFGVLNRLQNNDK